MRDLVAQEPTRVYESWSVGYSAPDGFSTVVPVAPRLYQGTNERMADLGWRVFMVVWE